MAKLFRNKDFKVTLCGEFNLLELLDHQKQIERGKGSFTEKKNFMVVAVVACHCAAVVSGNAVGEEVAEAWQWSWRW